MFEIREGRATSIHALHLHDQRAGSNMLIGRNICSMDSPSPVSISTCHKPQPVQGGFLPRLIRYSHNGECQPTSSLRQEAVNAGVRCRQKKEISLYSGANCRLLVERCPKCIMCICVASLKSPSLPPTKESLIYRAKRLVKIAPSKQTRGISVGTLQP